MPLPDRNVLGYVSLSSKSANLSQPRLCTVSNQFQASLFIFPPSNHPIALRTRCIKAAFLQHFQESPSSTKAILQLISTQNLKLPPSSWSHKPVLLLLPSRLLSQVPWRGVIWDMRRLLISLRTLVRSLFERLRRIDRQLTEGAVTSATKTYFQDILGDTSTSYLASVATYVSPLNDLRWMEWHGMGWLTLTGRHLQVHICWALL